MTQADRDLLVARICAGSIHLTITDGRKFLVRRPSREHVYLAHEVYAEALESAADQGLYSDEELVSFMLAHGLWDEQRESTLAAIPKQLEDAKVSLYRATFRSNERAALRKVLEVARRAYSSLSDERHQYGYLTASGAAAIARARYLTGVGLHTSSGRPLFPGNSFWKAPSGLLDEVMGLLAASRLDDTQFRDLARNEPFRTLWTGAKVEHCLFGIPPVDWTDDQRSLVNWAQLYDNIYQHPEAPPDDAIADDDLLDGWLIIQRRAKGDKGDASATGNAKIDSSQEVYRVAETIEDARSVVALNDNVGGAILKQRMAHLKNKGQVDELDMPDTKRRVQMEATQMMTGGG